MPAIYIHPHVVSSSEIDRQQHANNISYLKWMQDAAVAHSVAQGWPMDRYREHDWSWVVRSHFIEYRRPAFVDESIRVETWISGMRHASTIRKYRIIRVDDEQLLARAETTWAFVDTAANRPIKIPAVVVAAFEVIDQ